MVIGNDFVNFMLNHESYPGGPLDNSWKKQAYSFKKMSKFWRVEKSVGKDKFWNCTQLSPPTPNGWIFVSWDVLPVTLDKFQWIKEIDTKNVGGTHNRSFKAVTYTLDEFFKLFSQQLILEGERGGVIKNSFENTYMKM